MYSLHAPTSEHRIRICMSFILARNSIHLHYKMQATLSHSEIINYSCRCSSTLEPDYEFTFLGGNSQLFTYIVFHFFLEGIPETLSVFFIALRIKIRHKLPATDATGAGVERELVWLLLLT